MRSSTAPSTPRTSGGSTSRRLRPAGRSTVAAGTTPSAMPAPSSTTRGSRPGRTTNPSACSRSYARDAVIRERETHSPPQPPSASRSEVAWLEGAKDDVDAATAGMLSTGLGDPDSVARLRFWRRLAGLDGAAPVDHEGPYALGLAGRWDEAAEEWDERSRPYEASLARSRADDVEV